MNDTGCSEIAKVNQTAVSQLSIGQFEFEERVPWKPVIENAKDGTLLVLIPEGEFLAGGNEFIEGDVPFPARLPAFYLALHCVTNAQYARFLNAMRPGPREIYSWICLDDKCFVHQVGEQYVADGGKEEHPMVGVSWYGAEAYCTWAGLRLPSELQWEKAARGTDGRTYPWGNGWDETKCRNDKNKGNERTSKVWGYPYGNSPFGISQLSGNIWEWCADWYDKDAYKRYKEGKLDPPGNGASRVSRGGAWSGGDAFRLRCAFRHHIMPSTRYDFIGFRCAMDVVDAGQGEERSS